MTTTYRAGVIGRTGEGDYGHLLDTAFLGLPDVELVAVADSNEQGLASAGHRTGATRLYADYRRMVEDEDLDLVAVSPRWPDCHEEMVVACADAGVRGVLCEKPFARTLAEADAMIDATDRNGTRLVVAHRRANAYEQHAKRLVDMGEIGEVRALRGRGKADHRAGAVDLMVLGAHIMDSMRFFAASNVEWAFGHVSQDGRDVTAGDAHEGEERIGLVAGNRVTGYFAFANGVSATFDSYPGLVEPKLEPSTRSRNERTFGFEVYGTDGIISLRDSPHGEMYLYPHGRWIPGDRDGRWERVVIDDWDTHPDGLPRSYEERMRASNRMLVRELIEAVERGRDVVAASSGRDARAALEMVMAVHESQRLGSRVAFPLENRDNPYETWRRAVA